MRDEDRVTGLAEGVYLGLASVEVLLAKLTAVLLYAAVCALSVTVLVWSFRFMVGG